MSGSRSTLDREGLALLLARLGEPQNYELLRRRLLAYFGWEQCCEPEQLADIVIDRLARKLAEGTEVVDWKAYAAGIARMVFKEQRTAELRATAVAKELEHRHKTMLHVAATEPTAAAFEACLKHFSELQREQLLHYYDGAGAVRIENRRRLAERMGVAQNTMRNRMLRLRRLLADCMRDKSMNSSTTHRGPDVEF